MATLTASSSNRMPKDATGKAYNQSRCAVTMLRETKHAERVSSSCFLLADYYYYYYYFIITSPNDSG